jgi:hypothetical protein
MASISFGGLTTTAVTADQVVLTDTPAGALSLKTIVISGYLTTYSATESNMGVVKLQVGGVDKMEYRIQNTDIDTIAGVVVIPLGNGISFTGSEVVRVVVTPAAVTSMRWTVSFFYQ